MNSKRLCGELCQALLDDNLYLKIVQIDPSTELIDMTIFVQYSEIEYESHGSASAMRILARLPDHSIVWLFEDDELDGFTIVKSENLSDLASVKNWLPSVDACGDCFLERSALVFFGDAETVRRGSEFNSAWSSSLEKSLTFEISEKDLKDLWHYLEAF